jgi:hypothetical protein
LSVALHGGLVVLALTFVGARIAKPPRVIELTPIDVTIRSAAPPPSPPSGSQTQPASGKQRAGTLGRRGHTVPAASRTQPPAATERLADLAVRYEAPVGAPTHAAGKDGQGLGAALSGVGDGAGYGMNGAGPGLEVPEAPPSAARDPRPKQQYGRWTIAGAQEFANRRIEVELHIDAAGRVSTVKLIDGVGAWIDATAVDLARKFEFYPALNDAGEPVGSDYRWTFTIRGS